MFKAGDKVISPWDLDTVGTVRARYKHNYLVSWPKWKRLNAEQEKDLCAADSPLIAELKELERRMKELDSQKEELEKQGEEILKRR